MSRARSTLRSGMTLVELMIAGTVSFIVILAVGILLDGGNRAWTKTYELAHSKEKEEAQTVRAAFGSLGRRANRGSYTLYQVDQGVYTPVRGDPTQAVSVVFGDAVEFRYWDVPLDASDSYDVMDTERIATAYALFYLESGQLKVDYGPYPPGAVPAEGGSKNTTGVTTTVLAEHVTADSDTGPFSFTAYAGVGQGCVRLKVTLTDPDTDETTPVMTAALLRNIWPR
ncbi:MAG: hypothetical protein JW993_07400 [Sedimentisphaerales bacterium]|nr:hypothetical protein [Sedimentisphaerales bacterium]